MSFAPWMVWGADPTLTLSQVRDKAEKILTEARFSADQLKREAAKARKEGGGKRPQRRFDQGPRRRTGTGAEKRVWPNTVKPSKRRWALFKTISDLYQELWSANEAALVKLAMTVAERVVLHELETSPELVAAAFQAAIQHLQEQHRAVFRIHPDDLSILEKTRTEMTDQVKGLVNITFPTGPGPSAGAN